MTRSYWLSVLLVLPILVNAGKAKETWQGPNGPVYVITHNHYAEGFTPNGETARFGDLLAIEIFNPKNHAANDSSYKIGEGLAMFTGGQKVGSVKIRKVVHLQCDSSAALVSEDNSSHLTKDEMAIASNAGTIHIHQNAQRKVDSGEIRVAQQFAMNEFRKHGVPEGLLSKIKVGRLVATKLDDTGSDYLVGDLSLVSKSVRHEVFLIGKLGSADGTSELSRYHKTTDLVEGTDSEAVRFVDQLDFNGVGTDEIVVEVTGYENEEFQIYSRQNGTWKRVHVGGQGGC